MSIATRLGDWGGQGHMGEQAEAGGARIAASIAAAGAMQSCHPFAAKSVHIPGDPLAPVQASIPSGYVRCCAPTPPADVTRALGRDQWPNPKAWVTAT